MYCSEQLDHTVFFCLNSTYNKILPSVKKESEKNANNLYYYYQRAVKWSLIFRSYSCSKTNVTSFVKIDYLKYIYPYSGNVTYYL